MGPHEQIPYVIQIIRKGCARNTSREFYFAEQGIFSGYCGPTGAQVS